MALTVLTVKQQTMKIKANGQTGMIKKSKVGFMAITISGIETFNTRILAVSSIIKKQIAR